METSLPRRAAAALVGTAAAGLSLLIAEALVATYRTYLPADSGPPVDGEFGAPDAPAVHLVLLGDSTATGVGVMQTAETVGGRLAGRLAQTHRVTLASVAVSGSRAGDLGPQVSRALLLRPDIAVILIGANDATHGTPLSAVAHNVHEAVQRLRDAGVAVVLGSCPDMGARAFLPPLRQVVAWQGRRVARVSAIAAHELDASVVPIGDVCGPMFRVDPSTLSIDAFHPSARGYRLWADALWPAVQHAVATLAPH